MARQFLATLSLPSLSQNPSTGNAGSLYYNTTTNALMMHTGSEWMPVNASQYVLENHIHTYDGDVHTVYAGSYNPNLSIFDGGTSGQQYNSQTGIDGGVG